MAERTGIIIGTQGYEEAVSYLRTLEKQVGRSDYVARLNTWVREKLDEMAPQIQSELRAACPVNSGEAQDSIRIEVTGDRERFVGSTNDHLFFADEGNNQRLSVILPVRARALHFKDGTWHSQARTYEGKHFVRQVADRHR